MSTAAGAPVPVERVALVGPRAAGKSTIGPLLANALGWRFVDADDELATAAGEPAGDHLRRVGEPAFRALEERITLPLLSSAATVVALGGGAVLSAAVRAALREPGGFTALLLAPAAVLAARQRAAPVARPPLTGLPLEAEVAAVLGARLPLYRAVADGEFDTSSPSAAAVAADLAATVRARRGARD